MRNRFEGRVAIVTGAGSGIGRAVALRFAQEGAKVCVADINVVTAEETAEMARDAGGSAISHQLDVTDVPAIQAMVARVEAEQGVPWVCVANAGAGTSGSFLDVTPEEWDRGLAVNLSSALFTLQAAARSMVRGGAGGRLIGLSSVAADWAGKGSPCYGIAKLGVRQLMRSVAQQVGPYGITANSLGPALALSSFAEWMRSPEYVERLAQSVPVRRVGHGDDVAAVAAFLASDEAAYITGSYYAVDGGVTDSMDARIVLGQAPATVL